MHTKNVPRIDKRIFRLHADVCKMLAQPLRLEILFHLRDGELTVKELSARTAARGANLSQHLALMRQQGIVDSRKEGVWVYYRIANRKTLRAFELMRQVLLDKLKAEEKIAEFFEASAAP